MKPEFIALHMQEVGGKTYEKSMEYVQDFIKLLCESKELENYNRIRVYLDEDYTSAEHFTVNFLLYEICLFLLCKQYFIKEELVYFYNNYKAPLSI